MFSMTQGHEGCDDQTVIANELQKSIPLRIFLGIGHSVTALTFLCSSATPMADDIPQECDHVSFNH